MSTVHFTASELAVVYSSLASPLDNKAACAARMQALVDFAVVNATAYGIAYNEEVQAVTAEEIEAASSPIRANLGAAIRTLGSLEYNCDGLLPDRITAALGRFAMQLARRLLDRDRV